MIEFKQTIMYAFLNAVDYIFLLHKKFGHFNYSTLKHMNSNDLVQNLPTIQDNDDVCKVC